MKFFQAIAYTLQQYYDKQNDKTIFHVMYNDEVSENRDSDSCRNIRIVWFGIDKCSLDHDLERTTDNREQRWKPLDICKCFFFQPWGSKSTSGIKLEEILSNRVYSNYTHEDDSTSTAFGHTKGTIFFDGTSGVWLVHSVPLFPNPTKYEYPVSGHDYGQTMLCMTFKYAQLKSIGTQLFFNRPNIYSSNLPTNMAADNADLAKAIAGQYQKGQPFQSVIELETMAGYSFTNFAKSKEFNAGE